MAMILLHEQFLWNTNSTARMDPIDAASLAVLQELLPVGADINGRNAAGGSVLWYAAWQGELVVVQWLAGHGGSVTQPSNTGQTPLFIAAHQSRSWKW